MSLSKFTLSLLVTLFLAAATTFAAAPDDFSRVTTVDGINLAAQKIIIGDVTYNLHSGVVVRKHSNGNLVGFNELAVGTRVGCEISEEDVISEIWILSDDYDAIERND